MDLKPVLKTLLITYGPLAVQRTFDELVGELRREIEQLGSPVSKAVVAVETPTVKVEEKPKVKEVRTVREVLKDLVVQPKPVVPVATSAPDQEKDKFFRHKIAIEKRAAELKAQGKDAPWPLLSQENMKTWIEKDGMTYWKIAEMVGAPDKLVSAMAKLYNLQSNASKMIQFKKQQK